MFTHSHVFLVFLFMEDSAELPPHISAANVSADVRMDNVEGTSRPVDEFTLLFVSKRDGFICACFR
jgi:hypothetical protein